MVQIDKISELNNKRVRNAIALFNYFKCNRNAENLVVCRKQTASNEFNVTEHTVGNWINALVSAGVLKYKYSGQIMINPDFFYSGSESDYNATLNKWNNFKSDIRL